MDPRSAYIHVPFCAHRCGYCNFTVVAGRGDLVDPFLKAIALELRALGSPRPVDTLYFGGGTPTQLSNQQLERLLHIVLAWHPPSGQCELTVEVNPADVDDEKMALLAAHGTTRISIGGQSFDPAKLQTLERDHQAGDIARTVRLARQHGMSVSLDLIFASPGETLDSWKSDLHQALALRPDHLSAYGLTIERGTTFFNRRLHGELVEVDERLWRLMYLSAIDGLTAAGFEHYEVSSFARPGRRSRHNEVYWSGQGYYAAGPGAARYVGGCRSQNHRSTSSYLARVLAGQSPVAESQTLGAEDRARETLVLGLRRMQGVERREFAATTGFSLDMLAGQHLPRYLSMGLLEETQSTVRLTRKGLLVSDSIWPDLLA